MPTLLSMYNWLRDLGTIQDFVVQSHAAYQLADPAIKPLAGLRMRLAWMPKL